VKSFSIYVTSLLFVIDAHAVARDFPVGKTSVERRPKESRLLVLAVQSVTPE
jgi:hypothetical protein